MFVLMFEAECVNREAEIELAWRQHNALFKQGPDHTKNLQIRNRLAEAQNWRCCYCGIRMEGERGDLNAPTIEHIVPRSRGGLNDMTNLVIACSSCNSTRGSKELEEEQYV